MLSAVAFSVALGFGIVAPAIPLFAKHFGVNNAEASSVVSAFALMRLVGAPFAGRLVDRLGERVDAGHRHRHRRRLEPAGRASRSPSASSSSCAASAAPARRCSPCRRLSLLLRVVGARPARPGDRRVPGGLPVRRHHRPARSAAQLTDLVAARTVLHLRRHPAAGRDGRDGLPGARAAARARGRGRHDHAPTPFLEALRNPAYRAALVNNFANGWALFGVRSSLVPLLRQPRLLHRTADGPATASSSRRSCRPSCCSRPDGWSTGRGRRPFLRVGAATRRGRGLVLAFSRNLPPFIVAMALFGAASALLIDVRGGRRRRRHRRARRYRDRRLPDVADAGAFTGPLVAGRLSDLFSFRAAFLATALVSGVAFIGALVMPETRPSRSVAGGAPAPGREALDLRTEPEDA